MSAAETIRPSADGGRTPVAPPPVLIRMMRSVAALMLREMASRYGRSPGGYLWALLEPIGGIVILSAGFSMLIHQPPLGSSFLLFYATGFLPFTVYQSVSAATARALSYSKPLLGYPSVTWFDAVVARVLLNAMTAVLVSVVTFVLIQAATGAIQMIAPGPMVGALAFAILLGIGVGVLNCVLMGFFPVWGLIWSIATRPLFLASGVIILYESMPDWTQKILWYNPLIHILALMRTAFYPTYQPEDLAIPYTLGLSLGLTFLGLLLLRRWHREILSK